MQLTTNAKPVLIRRMKTNCIVAGWFALISLAFCGTLFADDPKAIEQTLRDLDTQWSAAAAAKDLDKTVSFYSEDAIVMAPNAPADTRQEAIRQGWKTLLDSVSDMSWKTTRVEIAKSGDLAVLTGTYKTTMSDGTKDVGKYCEVWERKANGDWKCGTDIFNSDLPAAPASSPAPGAAEKK